jgi:MYXO-CTERM domain-containing protein
MEKIMTFLQKHFCGFAVASLFVLALPTLRADEWDKRTVLTINQAIQVPNTVLQPGTYVFRLLDNPGNRDIVQIFDKNEQHLITTILALPNYRLEPTGKTVFTFWETPAGNPPAVRAWFYPGDNYGQEFVYPKNLFTQAAATPAPVTATQTIAEQPAPAAPPQEQAQSTPPPPPPAAEPAPQPPTEPQQAAPPPAPEQPQPTQPELPHTASPVPLIGFVGLVSLAGFAMLRRRASSR